MHNLQKNWKRAYPYTKKGKNNIIRLWKCIPATLCWNLWLARNNHVFKNKRPNMDRVIAKTIANISEVVSANFIVLPDQESWTQEERDWYSNFKVNHTLNPPTQNKANQKQAKWKLRGTKDEVRQWINKQDLPLLFFDGASKNNPGAAGAGGVIKDQEGKHICSYEWGLGKTSNNAAEAYSLLLGTTILSNLGLKNPIIIGDSAIIISAMVNDKDFNREGLNNIRKRITENTKFGGCHLQACAEGA